MIFMNEIKAKIVVRNCKLVNILIKDGFQTLHNVKVNGSLSSYMYRQMNIIQS